MQYIITNSFDDGQPSSIPSIPVVKLVCVNVYDYKRNDPGAEKVANNFMRSVETQSAPYILTSELTLPQEEVDRYVATMEELEWYDATLRISSSSLAASDVARRREERRALDDAIRKLYGEPEGDIDPTVMIDSLRVPGPFGDSEIQLAYRSRRMSVRSSVSAQRRRIPALHRRSRGITAGGTDRGRVAASFSHSVVTKLPRDRAWALLTDISNWPTFSDIYSDLRWDGTPWAEGSALVGQLNYPIVVSGRYVIKKCNPPALIRYLSQTQDAGFATERTIHLEELPNGTLIRAEAFVVGRPEMPGGASEFLRSLTLRWFDEFARFCDNHAVHLP